MIDSDKHKIFFYLIRLSYLHYEDLLLIFVFVFSIEYLYTHAVGIDLTYECISTNQYKIFEILQRGSGVINPIPLVVMEVI